jgi:hypothetical protein
MQNTVQHMLIVFKLFPLRRAFLTSLILRLRPWGGGGGGGGRSGDNRRKTPVSRLTQTGNHCVSVSLAHCAKVRQFLGNI